jgi:hypothetical protein
MARPDSDIDVRGVLIPPSEYFHGYLKHFEQATESIPKNFEFNGIAFGDNLSKHVGRSILNEEKIDSVIYDIRKFCRLAADSNPSLLELLYADENCRIITSPLAELLLENRDLFLSIKAKWTYSGYAISQLKRIRTHRQWLLNPPTSKPTRADFCLPEHTTIPRDQLMAAESLIKRKIEEWLGSQEELPREVLEDIRNRTTNAIKDIWSSVIDGCWVVEKEDFGYRITKPTPPINEYGDIDENKLCHAAGKLLGYDSNFLKLLDMERGYRSAIKQFQQYEEWKTNRNPVRAELEAKYGFDCKHGMMLVRLMRMCKEIMELGKVIVKRPDAEELLAIRNGAWSYDQLIEWAENQEKELNKIYESGKSSLPKTPDHNKLDELCQRIVEKFLSKGK